MDSDSLSLAEVVTDPQDGHIWVGWTCHRNPNPNWLDLTPDLESNT